MKMPMPNKRGISVVLTTLIIVVASVVLGTAVTLFGTSLFQSGSLQSAISVTNQHLWYDQSNTITVGAYVVRNTGDKILAVDSITIRGSSVPFSSWYYNNTQIALTGIGELGRNQTNLSGSVCATNCLDKDNNGTAETKATQASGPVTLQTGETAIIYYIVPSGKITSADTGASASVSVFAGSAGSVTTVTVAQVA